MSNIVLKTPRRDSCTTTVHSLLVSLTAACILLAPAVAQAVVVFRQGEDKPVMGFLLSQNDDRVVVRRPLPNGRFRDEVFLRSEIADLIFTVDRKRLEALSHDRPKEYRDYADELAAKRQDPEARFTAIRLYLIAAHLDPGSEGRSAMLGMIALARSESEEARFRAMAYLLDADHDRALLKTPQLAVDAPTSLDAAAKAKLVEALRLVRQGNKAQASTLLADPELRKHFGEFEDLITYPELLGALGPGAITPSLLRKVVALELALSSRGGDDEPDRKKESVSWQQALRRDGSTPLPVLTLESLTEFNPRDCHYRAGKWLDPEA